MSVAQQIFEEVRVLPEPAQKSVLEFVEKLAFPNPVSKQSASQRVQLPLIDSKEPGTLDLTNADIEELLA